MCCLVVAEPCNLCGHCICFVWKACVTAAHTSALYSERGLVVGSRCMCAWNHVCMFCVPLIWQVLVTGSSYMGLVSVCWCMLVPVNTRMAEDAATRAC